MSSRRFFLQATAGTLGACLAFNWRDVAAAAHEAHQAARSPDPAPPAFFTPQEFAVVEAMAAQIVPSDATPGAREAGAAHFIDRALASFFAYAAPGFRSQLAEFQADCRARHPDADSFATLTHEQQVDWLRTREQTPLFTQARALTLLGLFSLPEYGGNRCGLGWQLIGFEDRHVFAPPFGDYDRDYPGFGIVPPRGA